MTHFTTEAWIDYVRGLGPATESRAMRAHLEAGCRRCSSLEATLRRLAGAAASERRWQVPAATLRLARVYFSLKEPSEPRPDFVALKQLSDTAHQPAPAGVRSSAAAERRLVYHSDEYVLELALQERARPPETALQGQVVQLERGRPEELPVILVADGEIVASTLTSHGLFQIDGDFEPPCELLLFPDEERCLTAGWDSA